MKMPDVEVVIVGYGFEYVVMATNCARSIRRTNPGMPIRLVTNAPGAWAEPLRREFDLLEFRDEPDANNRAAKLAAFDLSSAERVLYLDADAEVRGDLLPAFRMLDAADVLLRPFDLPSKFPHMIGPDLDGQLYPQYWGGMLFFRRSPAAERFFTRWLERYETAGIARDQPALARAIHDSSDLRVMPMNALWGIFSADLPRYPRNRPQPRIYHYADVSNDPEVLASCAAVAMELEASGPKDSAWTDDINATVRRFRRIQTFWYRNRVMNPIARAAWRTLDRAKGRSGDDVRKKRPKVAGEAWSGQGADPLWVD